LQIGLMVEGQNGLTWERWEHILALAERLNFPSLFRSDHYFISQARQESSIEAYLSFALAAKQSSRLRFGPMVTPVTFRSPVEVGRMAAQLDLLSGGRFVMGLGAGWNEAEHRAYGVSFPPLGERFDRLEEAIQLMQVLWTQAPGSYEGKHYRLDGADLQPKPAAGRPPILIGGGGEKRTLKLVARYADEWNGVVITADDFARKLEVLERHCEAEKRDPATIRKSMMTFGIVGHTEADLEPATRYVQELFGAAGQVAPQFRKGARERGMIIGTTGEVLDQLGRLAELGMDEVLFQHLLFNSDDVPEYLAAEIAPAAARFWRRASP
jgi:F420-dependent oxidoreductase-like protein